MAIRRPLRVLLIAVAVIVVLLVGGVAIVATQFDPNQFKPQIEAAVKRATGRDLTLRGKIGLVPSLTPTIEAQDVAFSNPPGYSRPQMATLQSMQLKLALLPLLSRRVEIASLVLDKPDILLESNAAGAPNWQMTPEVSPTAQAGSQAPATGAANTKTDISIASIQIHDGTLAYRDDRTGQTTTLGLGQLALDAASADAPVHLTASATYSGLGFDIVGDTGSLTRLQEPSSTAPWPVKITVTTGGAVLNVDGQMTQPLQGKGYTGSVSGAVPDVAALQQLLPKVPLPALHDVRFAAKAADKGGRVPDISAITLHIGASNIDAQVPTLQLASADISSPAVNQPTQISVAGTYRGTPLSLAGHLGALATLLPGGVPAPFVVDITGQAAGADVAAKGSLANAATLQGLNLALTTHVPDLAVLGSLAGTSFPSIKTIAFQGDLSDATGGLRAGFTLRNMRLTSNAGDVAGDVAVVHAPRWGLTANLASNAIDADVIQSAIDQMPKPPAPAPTSGAQPAPAAAKSDGRMFSDQPIPFDALRLADADVTLSVAKLHSGGADYRSIVTHGVLRNGTLIVEPLNADLPAGHLAASAQVDASKPSPAVHLVVHAPGLALRTILQAAHEPSYANGNLEVYADLRGIGNTPHAIAGSLSGPLGLAMAGGTIDNRLLGSVLGKVMDSLNALNLVGKGGTSELRCFALRLDMQNGTGRLQPLALNSSLLTMTGGGTVNLGNETLALQLLPQARIAGSSLVIPIDVAGPIRNPKVDVNKLGATEKNVGSVAGIVLGNATPLGAIGGLLGADKILGGQGDICPAALAAARGQAAPASPSKPTEKLPNPAETLRNLFR